MEKRTRSPSIRRLVKNPDHLEVIGRKSETRQIMLARIPMLKILSIFAVFFLLAPWMERILAGTTLWQADPHPTFQSDDPLATWIARQKKIETLLPQVIPAVVALEGGSGVIVSPDGLILTAAHVVGFTGRRVEVQLSDGRKAVAKTLGTHEKNDTAALKLIDAGPWPHITLPDTNQIEPGQWCLALGYPSSFPRNQPATIRLGRILQHHDSVLVSDCSIMGGDSGGPLLNLEGQLIGINSRVKNSVTQNNHIFIQTFIDQWQSLTLSVTPTVSTEPTPPTTYLGVKAETDQTKVRIRSVIAESPAALAGLLPEDVVLMFDGQRITDFEQILQQLKQRKPGDEIEIIINRYGTLISLNLVLGKN